ncbi:MAG TPA: hypothetical protein VL359_03560 [bacterium]|nr:hypothetical protein [bacterium]
MAGTTLLILAIAFLFYAALPAVGAFFARTRWRVFRATVTRASHYPSVSPAVVSRHGSTPLGRYRFFGTLEAIQGDDRIWLTNGRFSVAADLRNVRVYLIPEMERSESFSPSAPGASPAALGSVPWSRIFSLPEGTPVFVGGTMFAEEGRAVFRDSRATRLLVVIHDCPRETVVLHAISGGRQRNEYINAVTLPSVAVGSLSLVLLALTLLSAAERLPALVALTAGLAPLAPFLPPGFPLYFAYRGAWKKARLLRVQRDVVRLPLRWFPPASPRDRRATLLPDLEPYVMVRGTRDPSRPDCILSHGACLELPPGITRVEVALPARHGGTAGPDGEVVAFCGYSEDDDGLKLRRPEDPMADHVLLPGDPETLARESERAARASAMVSAVFIGLDVAVNLPLVFVLLSLVIR